MGDVGVFAAGVYKVAFTVGSYSYVVGAGDTVGASVVFASVKYLGAYSSPPRRRRRFLSEAVVAPMLSARRSKEASFIVVLSYGVFVLSAEKL